MTLTKTCAGLLAAAIMIAGCKSVNNTQKGVAIGAAGGGAVGAIAGKAAGNTALGAIMGAAVGGVTGAIIGKRMDRQAKELKTDLPHAKVQRVGEGIIIEFNERILFTFAQYDLSLTARNNLDILTHILQKYPDTDIEIQGHTDNVGTDNYNQDLSEKRAGSVASYLRNKEIENDRISIKGFGEDAPKYSNITDAGRAQNRRVEFLITANDKMKEDAAKQAHASR